MKTATNQISLSFTREFTTGTRKGSQHQDSIPFVSKDRAEAWLAGIARNSKAGVIDYKIASSNINEL